MATGTAETTPIPPPIQASPAARIDRYIEQQLDKTRSQVKLVDFFGSLMLLALGVLGFLFVTAVVDAWVLDLGFFGRLLALLVLVGGTGWFTATRVLPLVVRKINPAYAARMIEQSQPSLKNSLINFLLLRSNRSGVHDLVYQAVEEQAAADLRQVPVDSTVDRSGLIKLGYALAGLVVVCAIYKMVSSKDPFQTVARVLVPWSGVSRPARVDIEDVQPGNSQVFHGQTAKVSARVSGARSNDLVVLIFSTLDGQIAERMVVLKVAPDGLRYEGELSPGEGGIQQDVEYRVAVFDRGVSQTQLADAVPVAETERYRLSVLPAPTITVQSVQYVYPSYTKRPVPPASKQADLDALEGTKVSITATANLPIKSAFVEFDPLPRDTAKLGSSDNAAPVRQPQVEPMQVDGQEARCSFVLELAPDRVSPKYSSYQLRFITEDGHQNEQPILHRISVTRDLSPEIEVILPKEERIEVPEDGKQTIELKALDPDFALSKISLRAVSGGVDQLDKSLLTDASSGRGQAVVSYEFKPADFSLEAGAEVVFWGVAADNRTAPRSGLPEPNTQRTRNYFIKITPALEKPKEPAEGEEKPEEKKPEDGEKEPKPGDKPDKQPNAGEKEPKPGDKPEKNPGAGQNEPKPGDKSQEPKPGEKKPGEKNGGEGEQGQDDSGEGKSGGKPGEKPNEKPGEKPQGDKSDESAGGESGDKPGEKQGGKSVDNSGNGNSPDKEDGGKGGDGHKSKQRPGDDASKPSARGKSDQDAGGQDAAGGGKSGAGEKSAGKPGDKPQGAGQEGGEPGEQENNGNAQDTGGTPGQSNRRQGGPGGEKSQGGQQGEGSQAENREGPLHEGEVIERVNEHIKEQQEKSGQPTGAGKPGAGKPGEKQPGGAQQGEKQPGGGAGETGEKQPGEKPGEKQPGGGAGQTGEKQPGENPGEKQPGGGAGQTGEKQPGEKPSEKQPGGGAGQTGEKKPGGKQPGEEQPGGGAGGEQKPEKKPGESGGKDGSPQGGTETKPEGGGAGEKPEQKPAGGEGQNGKSGAGQKSQDQGGSPASQEKNQDRNKKPGSEGGGGEKEGNDAKSPSQSKKQSNSQGGEGGDQSGGGKQGGGQGAEQAGNDSAGGSTPGEQGNGKASEPGSGETSGQGGKGPISEKPTGVSGSEDGQGTNTKPGEGKEPGAGTPGNKGQKPVPQGAKPGQTQSTPGAAGGQPGGAGRPGDAPGESSGHAPGGVGERKDPAGHESPPSELPPEEKANLEYARKATDLALEHLRDQKDDPDPELLKKLGMTKDELAKFVERWESLKKSAVKDDAKGKRELDESLRSLGLRPRADKLRSAASKNDQNKGLLDQGSRSEPPPAYLEQFNAFKRGTARAEK